YMNLPICAVSFVTLWLSLRHVFAGRTSDVSWRTFGRTFDFVGLFLFMGGSSSIVIGFNFATQLGWACASTLTLIVAGVLVLVVAGFYEVRTKRDALFPPIAFRDRTIVITLATTFLHNFAFNAGTFYLALYFQAVDGLSPIQAGITMLPYSLGSSLASMPAAWLIGYWSQRRNDTACQKYLICAGLAISSVGFGLMMLMSERSTHLEQTLFPLIAGVGLGMLFHAPYQVFTRALRRQEVASGTSAFFLVRFTGATVGLAVAGAVFLGRLSSTLPPGVDASVVLESVTALRNQSNWDEVLHALSLAIKAIWAVCCPCLGVALLISMFTRKIAVDESAAARAEEKSAGAPVMEGAALEGVIGLRTVVICIPNGTPGEGGPRPPNHETSDEFAEGWIEKERSPIQVERAQATYYIAHLQITIDPCCRSTAPGERAFERGPLMLRGLLTSRKRSKRPAATQARTTMSYSRAVEVGASRIPGNLGDFRPEARRDSTATSRPSFGGIEKLQKGVGEKRI
ncbi:hypothetical protein TRAPUB_4579, partial [Trametes pubescens]